VLRAGGNAATYAKALAEVRKLDIGCIAVGQYLHQLPDDLVKAILNNTETKVIFRLSSGGSGGIERELPPLEAKDLVALEKYWGYANVAIDNGVSGPFGFAGLPPLQLEPDQTLSDKVRKQSRALIANPRKAMDRRLDGNQLAEDAKLELLRALQKRNDQGDRRDPSETVRLNIPEEVADQDNLWEHVEVESANSRYEGGEDAAVAPPWDDGPPARAEAKGAGAHATDTKQSQGADADTSERPVEREEETVSAEAQVGAGDLWSKVRPVETEDEPSEDA